MTNSSANSTTGVADLFHMLESNKLSDVEEIKKVFHDHFLSTKDSWLVNGLFDYYLSTDSLRAVEVLSSVRDPHDKHLFDKLSETLAAKPPNNEQKLRTITLLGHVARRQPSWLPKLTSHTLFKQLLHLLKIEEDIVLLMSALLLLIILLPMLPIAMGQHLAEINEVFFRLASFYYYRLVSSTATNSTVFSTNSLNLVGGCDADQLYLLHLQVGLHNLFHRLYAMYPCTFVSSLKQQYTPRDLIFKKVICPLLESVRMHPLLVTMSKDSDSRWKKMEHHDIVAECSRFSLLERPPYRDETNSIANMRFTPISETYSAPYTPISTNSEFPMVIEQTGVDDANQETFWSPSMTVVAQSPPPPSSLQATPLSHADAKSTPSTPGASSLAGSVNLNNRSRTSPPEAAVEATPETTPVKDLRLPSRQVPVGSAAVRALSGFGNGPGLLNSSRPSTPTQANHLHHPHLLQQQQQQSHHHPLVLSSLSDGNSTSSSILDRKLNKIVADRQNAMIRQDRAIEEDVTPVRRFTPVNLMNICSEQQQQSKRVTPVNFMSDARRMTPVNVTSEQVNTMLNGRVDSWHQMQLEDQEVSDIVSSTRSTSFGSKDLNDKGRETFNDLSRKVRLKFYCKYPTPPVSTSRIPQRPNSCPALPTEHERPRNIGIAAHGSTFRPVKAREDMSTQTTAILPYESFLFDVLERPPARTAEPTPTPGNNSVTPGLIGGPASTANDSGRLSPSAMLERYIEVCARTTIAGSNEVARPRSNPKVSNWPSGRRSRTALDDEAENGQPPSDDQSGVGDATSGNYSIEMDRATQQLQLMQMQLQFERQRREIHAERNRRLLSKLRDSRALEELNATLNNRLKMAENEIEMLKGELSTIQFDSRTEESKLLEAMQHWQGKCKEEHQRNSQLKDRIDQLEDELKNEKKKVQEHEKQTRAAEATLFEAAHQLKEALRAANQSEELKRVLDTVQKRFLLLGEAQTRIQEKMNAPVHVARQEIAQLQKAWTEEVSNLRRQLDASTLHLESVKSRLAEFEHRDARKEVQLVDQQRLLQELKEKHSAELEAVESKYKAQVEVNLLLEGRILELYGKLEQAMCGSSSAGSAAAMNLASSASPKERSPPLSASLASSSEGSLAFIHSSMNDCDPGSGEISNLQAIVEPTIVMSDDGASGQSKANAAGTSGGQR